MGREGEMCWTFLAFWVCLLCEPGLSAAIPVATEWPVTDTDDFTTLNDHLSSWWTSSDYIDPTVTTEKMFMIESTPPPPTEGMSELNQGPPNEVDSSGLVESGGTPGSPLASNESRIVSTTRVPSKVEPMPQASNSEERTEIQEQEVSAKVNSSNPSVGKEAMKTTPAASAALLSARTASVSLNKPSEVKESSLPLTTSNQEVFFPTMSEKAGSAVSSATAFLPPGLEGEGSLGTKDEDSNIGSESSLFIPRGETPTDVLPGPQEDKMPQSFSDGSRDPVAPSSVLGLLSSNAEQLPAGGIEPASARGSSPPEAEMVTAKQTLPPALPFNDSMPSSDSTARSPEPSGPVTVLISPSPRTRPDLDAEPVAAVGRGDADSSVMVTVSNSDRAATAIIPSADVGLSPESTSKVPSGEVQNPEGAAAANPSPTKGTKDISVDLAPLSNTPSDSSSLGSDTAPTLSDMQADSGDATVMDRPEELGGSASLIGEEVPSAPSAMESESATRGTYAAEGSGNEDVLLLGEEMVGTTSGINNNQDEANLLPLETLPGVDKTRDAATTRSAVIEDDGSGDFPPFLAESGTFPKSDRLSGEESTSSGTPLPESFSPGGQAGKVSSSIPSSENLASSLEDGVIVGGSRADNASGELVANEAVMAASGDSRTGTGLPSSDTVSDLTEEGKPLGALASGEISSQPSVQVGKTITTNHVLGEESPSASTSPTEIGEAFMADLISGAESPSVTSLPGAKSPLSSGTHPPLHPIFPVSNQPSLSNVLNPESSASKKSQFFEGPFNVIGKETLQGPSGAESQTVLPSTGMMGSTGTDLASENGSQLSPESAERIQPVPSEGEEQLEVYSSISETDASMAPSAGESQSASLSPDRTKANGSLISATEGFHLPPDVAGYEAGEGIADVSKKIPSLPVLSTDSGAALVPSEGVETSEGGKPLETLTDGETASQPPLQFGETIATNNVLGEDSPSASVSLTAGYMGSLPSQDAGAAVAGPGASKGITQLEGSSAVSEKETPSSSLATESQSSGTSAGQEASGSLAKIEETALSQPVVSKENQLFPDGSAGAEEKQPVGSSSMSEKEAPLTPLGTESQSASPSIDGMEVAASSKNSELIPSLHSPVASEHGVGPESISIVGGDKSSLAPSAKDSHSPGISFGEKGSGELGTASVENSGSSLLFNKGSASSAESGMSPENVTAQLGEKFGSIPGGESVRKPSSGDEPGAQNYNISGGTVLSGSSSLEGSLAAQGAPPPQASDVTDSSQLPPGNENISENGASPDEAGDAESFLLDGSRQPGAQSLGDLANELSSGLSSQTAEDTSDGKETGKIDSSSSDSATLVAGPSLTGLASPSNELLAPLWNSEGRGDADSFVSTVDKGTPAATGEEGHVSLPGAQLSPSGTGELRPVGEAKPGAAAKAVLQSSKDEVTGSSDEPSTSVLTSSSNVASGLESGKIGSMYGSSILPTSGSSTQIKPAVRVSEDLSGSTKSSTESKPEVSLTTSDVGQEKTKSSQSKSSDKKKENKKADKKQDSKKIDKKKESKNSDSTSKTGKEKNANENSGRLRVVPAVSTSTPSGVNDPWLYKLDSWIQVNYRQKCLNWVNHEPQPSIWNQNLPVCPCSVQQGLSDHRYTRRQNGWLDSRVTMLRSSMPNKYGAGVRCLYDKNNNQLVEGHQERVWKHWRRSLFADEELKLYHWCCNQAGSQQVCDTYNQKRTKIGCDGYRPPVQAPPRSSSEEEAENRERD